MCVLLINVLNAYIFKHASIKDIVCITVFNVEKESHVHTAQQTHDMKILSMIRSHQVFTHIYCVNDSIIIIIARIFKCVVFATVIKYVDSIRKEHAEIFSACSAYLSFKNLNMIKMLRYGVRDQKSCI